MKKEILKNFETIYKDTYKDTLNYIILNCGNYNDIEDILQETYIEFYRYLKKNKKNTIQNEKAYIIGIAKNIINKYYRAKYRNKSISIEKDDNVNVLEKCESLELDFITKENVGKIWDYLKQKNQVILQVFYMHFIMDLKISDIAQKMEITESSVKNYIYRTIKELKEKYGKEEKEDEKR